MNKRVYILSSDETLAEMSAYGPGWQSMWTDPEGRRLLPFRDPPEGHETMTTAEAIAHMAQFEGGGE